MGHTYVEKLFVFYLKFTFNWQYCILFGNPKLFLCPITISYFHLHYGWYAICLVAQSCPTLGNSMDCRPAGSPVLEDSPGKNTGVGCHALLQGIFPTQGLNPDLPWGRWILYPLSYKGTPTTAMVGIVIMKYWYKHQLCRTAGVIKSGASLFNTLIRSTCYHVRKTPNLSLLLVSCTPHADNVTSGASGHHMYGFPLSKQLCNTIWVSYSLTQYVVSYMTLYTRR